MNARSEILRQLKTNAPAMQAKALSILQSCKTVDELDERLWDNDEFFSIYDVSGDADWDDYFGGDYHEDKDVKGREEKIWIAAALQLGRGEFTVRLADVFVNGI